VGEISDVTDATFETEVIKSDNPVLVDFWAEWCAPCRQIAPAVKELAETYGDRLRVVKMDVDASPGTPAQYSVRSIPTLLFFKEGQVVDSLVGAVPKKQIADKIDSVLTG
jgi:thioredoxin 1